MGEASAHDTFIRYLNPKNREPGFTWEYCMTSAEAAAACGLFMGFPTKTFQRHKKELVEVARKAARDGIEQLLVESGVRDWLVL